MIPDSEKAFIMWMSGHVLGDIHASVDTDDQFTRIYRSGGVTDPGTSLDHPQMVVSLFGSVPPDETPKSTVATAVRNALARAFDMKGNTVDGCVVTDVIVTAGVQSLPDPSGRWHYQFTVRLTTHPS